MVGILLKPRHKHRCPNLSKSFIVTLVVAYSVIWMYIIQQQLGLLVEHNRNDDKTHKYNIIRTDEFPFALKEKQTCRVHTELTERMLSIDIGWANEQAGGPEWLKTLCPNIVHHFTQFPSFRHNFEFKNTIMPISTTEYIAQGTCTTKIVNAIAASINARLYLFAGSHLGAVIHGQPINWDDDVDMWMDFNKMDNFLKVCNQFGKKNPILTKPKHVELHCVKDFNSIKVWLQPEGAEKLTARKEAHYSPFVDLFLYKHGVNKQLEETTPTGEKRKKVIQMTDFFPTRPYYFGGAFLMGPPLSIAQKFYTLQNCFVPSYNHRLEQYFRIHPLERLFRMNFQKALCVDCSQLHKVFPFVYNNSTIKVLGSNQDMEQKIFPNKATIYEPLVQTSISQRSHWYDADTSMAQNLTNAIINLNAVEVDNSIAPLSECSGKNLKVVEFNANRGKLWLESAALLTGADVIILNGMDIGMARSDQQHTTRLLAHYLNMNYAWGAEFIELTLGDESDRQNINEDENNLHGLHGNAILSKCPISDTKIFRNPVGRYFDHNPNNVNANGMERRLGGCMVMLGRILVGSTSIVVGSVHKLDGYREEIMHYIQNSSEAVISGNQHESFCGDIGLNVISSNHNTWPASCESFGRLREDTMCSNMIATEVYTKMPCVTQFGIQIPLGDHALIGATFELPLK